MCVKTSSEVMERSIAPSSIATRQSVSSPFVPFVSPFLRFLELPSPQEGSLEQWCGVEDGKRLHIGNYEQRELCVHLSPHRLPPAGRVRSAGAVRPPLSDVSIRSEF